RIWDSRGSYERSPLRAGGVHCLNQTLGEATANDGGLLPGECKHDQELTSMIARFQLSSVPTIGRRYSYSLEPSVIAIVPIVRRQGYLTTDQLFTLCRWKSQRRAGRVWNNSACFVEEITRFALSATDERARIEPLTLLDAVEYPTASCILH